MIQIPSFQEWLSGILNDYYSVFRIAEPVKVNYVFSDNIVESYAELRPDHFQKDPDRVRSLSLYNGNTVPPLTVDGVFTVLINKPMMLKYLSTGNMTTVGTIVHETTHAKDFSDYARMIGASDYEDIISIEKNYIFQLWTEFNARAKGYFFVRKYTFRNMYDESLVDDVIQSELPAQEQLLYNNYHSTQDGFQQAYYVSHFLGRLYSLQAIYPRRITDSWLKNMPLFLENNWIQNWYWFLKKHDTLAKAYPAFDMMRKILNANFPWMT